MKTKSKTPFLDACAEAEYENERITGTLQRLLTERGWKYTSSTPGCYWLYEKKLPDGRTVLCTQDLAISMEKNLCGEEYPESD